MNAHETTPGILNIAETCAASLSVDDLMGLCEDKSLPNPLTPLTSLKLTYGPIPGSPALLDRLSSLYSIRSGNPLTPSQILITPGAIAANFLTLYALLNPGDHVICVYPTYQQLYSVPASLGCEVSLWKLSPSKKWIPDISELKGLIKPTTKMIIINNPNNPTGACIPKSVLVDLIEVAKEHDLIILSDEVYRPLYHGISPAHPDFPPSMLSLPYPNIVVTGSMSKAYSLAGIRLGWVATRSPTLLSKISSARDYTTISVSPISDAIAQYALHPSTLHALLSRNITLARTNLELLDEFVDGWSKYCEWVKPVAGTTAFIKFRLNREAVDAERLCKDVREKCGVLMVPGTSCFGEEWVGHVRVGYVCETEVLRESLKRLDGYMREEYRDL